MSRHHIMPPAVHVPPPPKKIETRKRRIGIGAPSEFEAAEEVAGETAQPAPIASRLLQQDFAEIEDAISKARHPSGRLSQATLSALLRVQELE